METNTSPHDSEFPTQDDFIDLLGLREIYDNLEVGGPPVDDEQIREYIAHRESADRDVRQKITHWQSWWSRYLRLIAEGETLHDDKT